MASSDIAFAFLDQDGPVPKSAARNPAGTAGMKETLTAIKTAVAAVENGSGIDLSGLTLSDNDIDGNDRLLVVTVDDDGNITGTVAATVSGIRGAAGNDAVAFASDETVVDGSTYTIEAADQALYSDADGLHDHTVRCLHATPASAIAITFPIDEAIASPLAEFVVIQDIEQLGDVSLVPESGGTINGGTAAVKLAGPGAVVTVTVLRNDGDNPVMLAVGALDGPVIVDSITLSNGTKIMSGTGSPENAVAAPKGSSWHRTDASDGNSPLYLKCTGTGNTGWKLVTVA